MKIFLISVAVFGVIGTNTAVIGSISVSSEFLSTVRVGDFRDILVTVPKPGFLGSTRELPPWYRKGVPKQAVDFETKTVRITVIEIANINRGIRIIMELSKVGSKAHANKQPSHDKTKPLYFAYLDIRNNSMSIAGDVRIRAKLRDGTEPSIVGMTPASIYRMTSSGIPFPLIATVPLSWCQSSTLLKGSMFSSKKQPLFHEELNSLSKDRDQSVFRVSVLQSLKVIYNDKTKSDTQKVPDNLTRSDGDGWTPLERSLASDAELIRYLSSDGKELTKHVLEGAGRYTFLAEEIQTWKNDQDWLWYSMERRDPDGNLMIRCKQIVNKNPDELIEIESKLPLSENTQKEIEVQSRGATHQHDSFYINPISDQGIEISIINSKSPAKNRKGAWFINYRGTDKRANRAVSVIGEKQTVILPGTHKLGGEILLRYLLKKGSSLPWAYISEVGKQQITFPEDAEIIISPNDIVDANVVFRDKTRLEKPGKLGLFYKKTSNIPLFSLKIDKINEANTSNYCFCVATGAYHAWLLNEKDEKHTYLGQVTVTNEPNKTYTLPVSGVAQEEVNSQVGPG